MSASPKTASATKILLGLSGGVDSSVSAYLLKEQGYDVSTMFMKNWEEDDTQDVCSATVDICDAQSVSDALGLEFKRINFASEYWDEVFKIFLEEYSAGRTPNPDILCNQEIKFKYFLDFALSMGAEKIATGHYARCEYKEGRYRLLRGLDETKDQSYFLYTLTQDRLSKVIFPIGHLLKTQVREIAKKLELVNHAKKDSTGICFIGEKRFKQFLSTYLPCKPGTMVDTTGRILGKHDGLMYYTLGQRQGLHIGGVKNSSGEPWYVVAKILKTNTLVVAQGTTHPYHFSTKLKAKSCTWTSAEGPKEGTLCSAKVRYRQVDLPCKVLSYDAHAKVLELEFSEPVSAVTPGQSVVLYDQEECLGGGIIESTDSLGGLNLEKC